MCWAVDDYLLSVPGASSSEQESWDWRESPETPSPRQIQPEASVETPSRNVLLASDSHLHRNYFRHSHKKYFANSQQKIFDAKTGANKIDMQQWIYEHKRYRTHQKLIQNTIFIRVQNTNLSRLTVVMFHWLYQSWRERQVEEAIYLPPCSQSRAPYCCHPYSDYSCSYQGLEGWGSESWNSVQY